MVVKLDRLGDCILCIPFLQNLRRSAPEASITGLVRGQVFDLAAACAFVDRIIAVARDPVDALTFHARTAAQLAGFDTNTNPADSTSRWCRAGMRISTAPRRLRLRPAPPLRLGFSEHCTPRKRIINAGQDRLYTHVVEDARRAHEVEHNLAMLAAMNARITTRRATLPLRGDKERAAAGLRHLWIRAASRNADRRRAIAACRCCMRQAS